MEAGEVSETLSEGIRGNFAACGTYELDDAVDFLRWRLFAALARSKLFEALSMTRLSNHGAKIVRSQLLWLQCQYHLLKLGDGRYYTPKPISNFIS